MLLRSEFKTQNSKFKINNSHTSVETRLMASLLLTPNS
ncbi:hypothetical protein COO91_05651 [Nostoc flagelliforme CCNUN1]|uniref:Uncharacterized protein n=1 Tax=Nostoc flagelliforme CCNUN1 TaxID=2038116 RepID=A0A2K8SWD9_9NOSO|nr:hypothetical protein COO91_05651 [Nostoc flagelliforme CCNUN1]